jgi:hypothetical protein
MFVYGERGSGSAGPVLLSLLVGSSWRPDLVVSAGGGAMSQERGATGLPTPARLWRGVAPPG